MDTPQKPLSTSFIDYLPAELHENKTWEIVYYVTNPYTGKLTRKRNRVKPLKNTAERRKLAKRMIKSINIRLEKGWNPFYQNKGTKELTIFNAVADIFLKRIEKDVKDNNLRYDTLKTYRSQIGKLKTYIIEVLNKPDMMSYQFDNDFVGDYLDYIRYTRGLSACSRDNCLSFLKLLSSFLIEKKYITANPTIHFGKTNRKTKTRAVMDKETRNAIFDYWDNENKNFRTLCMTCYYCLIRRTEITKLKVKDVNIEKGTLWVDSTVSKNRKGQSVTIPDAFLPLLKKHIKDAGKDWYLFTGKTFAPGLKKLWPNRITEQWDIMRKDIGVDTNIHWYSLKDSGITDLLSNGVPLIAVRDQARHHHSSQTDTYTPRNMKKANENIKSANI
tara:strand:- start:30311 stop:31471 length:1161 start_codon:yes stop_codon:yes gene_type:complete